MSTPAKTFIVICVSAGSFLAGAFWKSNRGDEAPGPGARRILYYHDPMHPAFKSDKPGVAPDCGMQLEPVYADGAASPSDGTN